MTSKKEGVEEKEKTRAAVSSILKKKAKLAEMVYEAKKKICNLGGARWALQVYYWVKGQVGRRRLSPPSSRTAYPRLNPHHRK